jgi:hypothetical protein
VDSPDPMSKFNASHSSNVSAMGKVSTTLSKILKDYDMEPKPPANPSPDSIVDDIYDFGKPPTSVAAAKATSSYTKWKGESISDVLRNSSETLPKEESDRDSLQTLHPPRKNTGDEEGTVFEKTSKDSISTMRRQKNCGERMDPLAQGESWSGGSRGGSRMVRTGGGKIRQPSVVRSLDQLPTSSSSMTLHSASHSSLQTVENVAMPPKQPRESTPVRKQLPTSRSLDTLSTSLLAYIEEEEAASGGAHSPIVPQRPAPPLSGGHRGAAPSRKSVRLTPTPPPSVSPPSASGSNSFGFDSLPSPVEGSGSGGFSRSRGRTYRPCAVNADIESCALDEREAESSLTEQKSFVQIEFEVTDRRREEREESVVDIVKQFRKCPTGSKPKRAGRRTVCVSGCSKVMMQQLLSRASLKRRKKSKYPLFFSPRFESIPEHEGIHLTIPRWVKLSTPSSLYKVGSSSVSFNALEKTAVKDAKTSASSRQRDAKKTVSASSSQEESPSKNEIDPEYSEWLLSQGGTEGDDRTSAELVEFLSAIRSNDGLLFKEMLANNPNLIYGRDGNGNTALILSTIVGWRKGIKLLIKKGADVNAQNRFGNTCLHFAHAMDSSEDIQRYFVKKNASTQIRNERGLCCISNKSETITCSQVTMI